MKALHIFDAKFYNGQCWRLVEAQHIVSTLKLVDSLDEQSRLEELLDGTKPDISFECSGLHYLLYTPFRYNAPYPKGSRFRLAGISKGVFYASEDVQTALVETAFYRKTVFDESPATSLPKNPSEFTAFCVSVATDKALDLTVEPLNVDEALWMHLEDYGACQNLALEARDLGVDLIRYKSVRNNGGINLAVLNCSAFSCVKPVLLQSWKIKFTKNSVQALCEMPFMRLEFIV
jgi:hypothetical protein